MDLLDITSEIFLDEDDIYYSKRTSDISYPSIANDICFQIEESSFWFTHRNNVIIESIKQFGQNRVLFDIGGGNGFVSKGLQDNSIDTVLVDPGKQAAKNAKKRGVNCVVCSTLENVGFKQFSLPSIGLFDVIEHIDNDIDFLAKIFNYLEDSGLVYISVPAYKYLWSVEDEKAGHFRRYSLKGIESLLEAVGFNIIYSTYVFSMLPIPIYIFRSLPTKLGLYTKDGDFQNHKKDHNYPSFLLGSVLDKILNWELIRVKMRKKIPFGGSCLIVGKK